MDVRARILEQTTRLIAQRGFEGTSLKAVADAVGVKKPSVLHHFESKEALRRAVLQQLLSRWSDVLPRLLLASTLTGLAKFDAVMEEVVGFFAADPDRARLILRELLDRPQAVHGEGAGVDVRRWVEVVASYIKKGQEAGQIQSEVDPEAYVLQVASLTLGVVANSESVQALLPDGTGQHRAIQELIRIARSSLFTQSYLAHQEKKRARPKE